MPRTRRIAVSAVVCISTILLTFVHGLALFSGIRISRRVVMGSTLLTVQDYLNLPVVPSEKRIAYAPHAEQFGDLYLPPSRRESSSSPLPPSSSPPLAVVIFVHGGCWRAEYGLGFMGKLCRAIADEQEVAVWNIEYRRLGNGGGWPTTFHDVGQAADHLRTLAESYNLDLNRVVSIGHSAGGHLALWLAARQNLDSNSELYVSDPLPLCGVIALAGIPDMAAAISRVSCGSAPQELLGGLPTDTAVRQHYLDGSPSNLLPIKVKQIFINGDQDPIVPANFVEDYVKVAQKSGGTVQFHKVPNAAHFELVTPDSHAWPVLKQSLQELLHQT